MVEYLDRIDGRGGMIAAIEEGFPQREIADNAYQVAERKASGDHVVVGVNRFVDEGPGPAIETHRVPLETERRKVDELRRLKAQRDRSEVRRRLDDLVRVAGDPVADLMPATIAAVKARATMGEIVNALRVPFGTYRETPVF